MTDSDHFIKAHNEYLTPPDVDNDEFECESCGRVFDIECSIRRGDELICEMCDNPPSIDELSWEEFKASKLSGQYGPIPYTEHNPEPRS